MAQEVLDTLGLKYPQPVLKIAVRAPDLKPGDILEVLGDCPTFEKDVRPWCERLGKVLLSIQDEGGEKKRIQIQFQEAHYYKCPENMRMGSLNREPT